MNRLLILDFKGSALFCVSNGDNHFTPKSFKVEISFVRIKNRLSRAILWGWNVNDFSFYTTGLRLQVISARRPDFRMNRKAIYIVSSQIVSISP